MVDETENGQAKLVGIVSYGLYKVSKREWIKHHRQRLGQKPTDAEFDFFASTQTDEHLENYRVRAKHILASYALASIEAERPKIVEATLRGTFFSAFWPSFWASIAFAVLAGALTAVVWISIKFNLLEALFGGQTTS